MKLIDRYLVVGLWKRLSIALSIVLIALLVERVLRLFDAVNLKGGPVIMVWEMALMLIPHYLGLALPAAFFFSIYLTVSSCHQNNEFDVLLGAGMSPARFAASFAASAVLLFVLSVALLGYVQPYSRYDYRAIHYLVDNVPWGTRIPERIFAHADKSATVSADHVDADGHGLSNVFIHLTSKSGETTIAAQRGRLVMNMLSASYRLELWDGVKLVMRPDGRIYSVKFEHLSMLRDLNRTAVPFRERGSDVRELTLSELASPETGVAVSDADAELHGRLARAVSVVFLPLLAIPLAITSRRQPRSAGIVLGALILVIYHYALQTLQGVAAAERAPIASLWIATAVFSLLSAALFWRTHQRPGENSLEPAIGAIGLGIGKGVALWRALSPKRAS